MIYEHKNPHTRSDILKERDDRSEKICPVMSSRHELIFCLGEQCAFAGPRDFNGRLYCGMARMYLQGC